MSFTFQGAHVTSPDIDHGDNASGEASPHINKGSFPRRATLAKTGVSTQARAEFVYEVQYLCELLDQTQSTLEAVQIRLHTLDQQQSRVTCQLDCHDLDVTAYVKSDSLDLSASTFMPMENIACVRDSRGKISIYTRPFIATTVKSPMKR